MIKNAKKIDLKYNLKIYFNFLSKYKWIAMSILFVAFIEEATRVVDRYLLKIIVDRGADFANNLITNSQFINILLILAAVFSGVIVIRISGHWMKEALLIFIESRMIADVKRYFFNHLIHLSHKFHTSNKTGSLISRIIRGSYAVERMSDAIVWNFIPLIFQVIVVSASLLYFDLKYVLVVFLVVAVFVLYSITLQQRQKKYNAIMNECEDIEKAYVSDVMTNIESIKHFGKENAIKKRFRFLSKKTRLSMAKFWGFFKWLSAGQTAIISLGTFFIVYLSVMDFLDGKITIGSLVFIFTIYTNLFFPLYSFVHGMRSYYRSLIDFNDLFQYKKIKNDIKDKTDAKDLKIKKGEVEFRDMSFKYKKRWIFENFNLKIRPNQKVALVGHSGCGKTTLMRLLYRFYDPDKGEIKIDNKDIKKFKQESLRSELSIVPQECILFDDTIYNNIAFSNPKASREDVMKAIKFAHLDRILDDFPKKEKTIVGERGVKLSGGEKQRVSIARAILADKKILVLDEATSSLDSQTEHDIQESLKKLMENRTSIIIAHRLSTIMNADKIVVMEKGKIVEMGNHKTLIKKKGLYKKLWSLQKGGYIK